MEIGVVIIAFVLGICEILLFKNLLSENAELSKKYNDLRVENARLKAKVGK